MITVCYRFAHCFKIMCIPQPRWTEVILLRPSQYFRSSREGEIEVAYIRCIDGREPEAFELWAFVEDGIREVRPYAWVQISDNFTEDTFYSLLNNLEVLHMFLCTVKISSLVILQM